MRETEAFVPRSSVRDLADAEVLLREAEDACSPNHPASLRSAAIP